MKKIKLKSFQDYIKHIETNNLLGYDIDLYRGQSDNYALLPAVAWKDPSDDTTDVEILMLEELKRRSPLLISNTFKND